MDLLPWYAANGRHDLPWRQTRDPYAVLVSELMLQQTQVPRVIPKYLAFLAAFPTIHDLARAQRHEVLRLWQGLGYNSRAVRLHDLAKIVVEEHGGVLPQTPDALRELPGIGPYTAGAILIFAHDFPAPSVDVNVARVVRRYCYGTTEHPPVREIEGRAEQLLRASGRPHDWHSAMMDFGSLVCTARNPSCASCPVRKGCRSHGPHPDERRKAKQPAFPGSNRWYRGQLLKLLLAHPAQEQEVIAQLPDAQKARAALAQLREEGIVSKDMLLTLEQD